MDGTAYLAGGTAWTQGDFAEEMSIYELEAKAGDVVVINSEFTDPGSGQLYMGRLAYQGNANNILGVISTAPAGILKYGQFGEHGKPIALTGTVPVKVTTENGPIQRGDLLTTSATVPGAAMKATAPEAGTLGIALEDYDSEGVGYVQVLLSINNKVPSSDSDDSNSSTSQISVPHPGVTDDVDNSGIDSSTSTSTTTPIDIIDESDYGEVTVEVAPQDEFGNVKVLGEAEFAGRVKVAEIEVNSRIIVKGEIIVAGDLDLSGAITTWMWDGSVLSGSDNKIDQIKLGDAVAVIGDNLVRTVWANDPEFRPAVGVAVAIKPYSSLSEVDMGTLPAVLQDLATSSTIDKLRMVKVAIGGIVKGYQDLSAGNRYFLALNMDISRNKLIDDSNLAQLLEETDQLIDAAAGLSNNYATEEIGKLSRTLTDKQPEEEGAYIQVIGIAKSASELLIQPSLNYAQWKEGYIDWSFGGRYQPLIPNHSSADIQTNGSNNNGSLTTTTTDIQIDVSSIDVSSDDSLSNDDLIVDNSPTSTSTSTLDQSAGYGSAAEVEQQAAEKTEGNQSIGQVSNYDSSSGENNSGGDDSYAGQGEACKFRSG